MEKKYKYKDLRTYSSTEWLAENKKKYQQVFDRWDTGYIYAELSFYNKYFDISDWEVEVELRCYHIKKIRKELCILPFKRKVSKYDNIIYVREGWGHKTDGVFWQKGTYVWEAFIDGEKVASKNFYIEDAGKDALKQSNPYCQIETLKLYEAPYDDVMEENRVFYKKFNWAKTRYVYAEVLLKNIHIDKLWQCEIFVKFYNGARELKGQVVRLQEVKLKDEYLKMNQLRVSGLI